MQTGHPTPLSSLILHWTCTSSPPLSALLWPKSDGSQWYAQRKIIGSILWERALERVESRRGSMLWAEATKFISPGTRSWAPHLTLNLLKKNWESKPKLMFRSPSAYWTKKKPKRERFQKTLKISEDVHVTRFFMRWWSHSYCWNHDSRISLQENDFDACVYVCVYVCRALKFEK